MTFTMRFQYADGTESMHIARRFEVEPDDDSMTFYLDGDREGIIIEKGDNVFVMNELGNTVSRYRVK